MLNQLFELMSPRHCAGQRGRESTELPVVEPVASWGESTAVSRAVRSAWTSEGTRQDVTCQGGQRGLPQP